MISDNGPCFSRGNISNQMSCAIDKSLSVMSIYPIAATTAGLPLYRYSLDLMELQNTYLVGMLS